MSVWEPIVMSPGVCLANGMNYYMCMAVGTYYAVLLAHSGVTVVVTREKLDNLSKVGYEITAERFDELYISWKTEVPVTSLS